TAGRQGSASTPGGCPPGRRRARRTPRGSRQPAPPGRRHRPAPPREVARRGPRPTRRHVARPWSDASNAPVRWGAAQPAALLGPFAGGDLLGEVLRRPDPLDRIQLALEPVGVLLLVAHHLLE